MFVFGGRTNPKMGLNRLNCFDLKSINWKEITGENRPEPRWRHTFKKVDKTRGIVFGGRNDEKLFNDCWIFDVNNYFSLIQTNSEPPEPRYSFASTVVICNGKKFLLIHGGSQTLDPCDMKLDGNVYFLDLETFTWSKMANGPALYSHRACTFTHDNQNYALFIGGITAEGVLNRKFWLFNLETKTFNAVSLKDWKGLIGFAAEIFDEALHIIGGGYSVLMTHYSHQRSVFLVKNLLLESVTM